ncbi:uncharacterized protein LOC115361323 [Myripristis murdjan]|uniref:Uncharacterized LOC115361323 n=1 Tax=Myripristis murdjan TaxID=586833 RepID=A0A668ATZ1_9TELE|nr:uncharacterized protein LOC115361323 [Myripristis murdjan]
MMCCMQRTGISLILCVVIVAWNTLHVCNSVRVGKFKGQSEFASHQGKASTEWERVKPKNYTSAEQALLNPGGRIITKAAPLDKSDRLAPQAHLVYPAAFPGEPLTHFSPPKLGETNVNLAQKAIDTSWIFGNVNAHQRPPAPDSEAGYQADFTGFQGVQGKVLGPSFDASPHFSEWLALRPLVQCDGHIMTLTASGLGSTNLLVDREGASPISLFQLPADCGYSVRMSWRDLVMMAPYDGCYITQENGSYVLPMLWWGNPLKLLCPVQVLTPTPSPSHTALSVLCSSYGIAVQIHGKKDDMPILAVVNGEWVLFISPDCAHHVDSHPGGFMVFIPFSAPCVAVEDGLHVLLLLDGKGYTLSCPVDSSLSPYSPSSPSSPPVSPSDPQYPYFPDPLIPRPTSPPPSPQPPTQEHLHYHYPGRQYPQLPQAYPPGPQHAKPSRPTPGSPPGSQFQQSQQSLYPMGPGQLPYSPGDHSNYPFFPYQPSEADQVGSDPNLTPGHDSPPHQLPKLPVGPPQHPSGMHFPYEPFYYPQETTTAVPSTAPPQKLPIAPYHHQFDYVPYVPSPFVAPVTQGPAPALPSPPPPPPPPPPPEAPKQPQHPDVLLYPPGSYNPYDPYGSVSYPQQVVPTAHPQGHRATCPPGAHTFCSYNPYPNYYYPHYHPPYPPHHHPYYPHMPLYSSPATPTDQPTSSTTSTTTSAAPTSSQPTPLSPTIQCQKGRMVALLPSAHPDSVHVRAEKRTWLLLSSVSPLCGYMLRPALGSGVIFQSPLPACHSQQRTPTTTSLTLRFLDLSMMKHRTVELQCPYQQPPFTPALVDPSKTKGHLKTSVVPKPKIFCSPRHMSVELPPGPISGIIVKDFKGNQMKLQDAPKHCRYSASTGKGGQIIVDLPLSSDCHMSIQGRVHLINIVYMTANGRGEAQLSCPVSITAPGKECNLPSEQRLPCGPGSLSQPQCLSLGCCFSKHPPACYYAMDECTIDRHFVFLVPASLMDPPLSPALLVAAGDVTCRPQKVTSDYALFKIPLDGCGTRRIEVGRTVIYMVEILNMVQSITLNYGTITRDAPVRLLVECRYLPGSVVSVSYMVKSPSLGPAIHAQGVMGVQLRIAKDAQYSSYYPQYHQPLQMLLGKPLYLEVRLLNSPDPNLVLLVHYCVAYPRSGHAVWVLLYNGCPNPLDPASQQTVLAPPPPPTPRSQTRRFTITTFQFLPDGKYPDADEEIYFMCSTEVCSPLDGPCVEGCFGQ